MNDNLIFLDIDGVIVSREGFRHPSYHNRQDAWESFSQDALRALFHIIMKTEAKVVISSTWRRLYNDEELSIMFKKAYSSDIVKIIGSTPKSSHGCRGLEIDEWRDANDHTGPFVILDDDNDMTDYQKERHFIRTKLDVGLTMLDAVEACAKLIGVTS